MKKIHVEGKADAQLLKSLGHPRKAIQRDSDKGDVCNKLIKSENEIGLIDEDSDIEIAQPAYLRGLAMESNDYKIKVYKDSERNNKVIVLCPRLEEWIIDVCKISSVDIGQFGFSSNPNKFHERINFKLDSFDKLIKTLIKAKAVQILYLMDLLNG